MNPSQIEELLKRSAGVPWESPPAVCRRHTRRPPSRETPAPAEAPPAVRRSSPRDVRSTGTAGAGPVALTHTRFAAGHASIKVTRSGLTKVEGRCWSDIADTVLVLWVSEDHVLDMVRVQPGELFRMETVCPALSRLEFHIGGAAPGAVDLD